jgi:hypothetical protein
VVNLIFGAGPTLAVGRYENANGQGSYFRLGFGVGFDVSGGSEGGASTSLGAFSGYGEAICGGASIVNGCVGGNASGTTLSGGGALGPSEVVVSGHTEVTQTWVSSPTKPGEAAAQFQCRMSAGVGLGNPAACR